MWLVAPESNSRFGVVLPLVLNSCSLKVNAKLCELVMFSSFSADFFGVFGRLQFSTVPCTVGGVLAFVIPLWLFGVAVLAFMPSLASFKAVSLEPLLCGHHIVTLAVIWGSIAALLRLLVVSESCLEFTECHLPFSLGHQGRKRFVGTG